MSSRYRRLYADDDGMALFATIRAFASWKSLVIPQPLLNRIQSEGLD